MFHGQRNGAIKSLSLSWRDLLSDTGQQLSQLVEPHVVAGAVRQLAVGGLDHGMDVSSRGLLSNGDAKGIGADLEYFPQFQPGVRQARRGRRRTRPP